MRRNDPWYNVSVEISSIGVWAGSSVDGQDHCWAERELQLKAKNERILEWRQAQESSVWEIAISQSDAWKCLYRLKKGKSSPDGVTAEMLLAFLEEQILCLATNIQDMFSSLNFQETWFRVMACLIPRKPHPRGLNEFRPISLPDHWGTSGF